MHSIIIFLILDFHENKQRENWCLLIYTYNKSLTNIIGYFFIINISNFWSQFLLDNI